MKKYIITVNGTPYDVSVQEAGSAGAPPAAQSAAPPKQTAQSGKAGAIIINAPMPGNINGVKVTAGQNVKTGDVLIVLEAMKMENDIVAPQKGIVASVNCAKGDVVGAGDVLITMD